MLFAFGFILLASIADIVLYPADIYLEPNDVITIIDEKTDTSGNYTIVGKSLSCGANTYRLQLTINKRPPILQEFIL